MGRRYVALTGSLLILIGTIISSTAHHMNPFIGELGILSLSLTKSEYSFASSIMAF
jgi:hypothetical protein